MNTMEMDMDTSSNIETVADNYNKSNRCESIQKTIANHLYQINNPPPNVTMQIKYLHLHHQ